MKIPKLPLTFKKTTKNYTLQSKIPYLSADQNGTIKSYDMDGLGELWKQIANIDSTIKLIAFLASIVFLIVSLILKYSNKISKQVSNLLIFFFSAIFLIACLAMILAGKRTDTLTLTLTLTGNAGIPYSSDQADFTVNSKTASVDYSPLAKSWTIVFAPDELPKDRVVYLSAQTKDHNSKADTFYRLTNDLFQTLVLLLPGKEIINADTTFSINLPDEKIRLAIATSTGLTYDPASRKNKVVVTYERSSIRHNQNGTYSFVSSCPVVLIDGKSFTLDNYFIPERVPNFTRDLESLKSDVQAASVSIATAYFRKNPNILVKWIEPRQH